MSLTDYGGRPGKQDIIFNKASGDMNFGNWKESKCNCQAMLPRARDTKQGFVMLHSVSGAQVKTQRFDKSRE